MRSPSRAKELCLTSGIASCINTVTSDSNNLTVKHLTSVKHLVVAMAVAVPLAITATGELGHYGSHPRPQVADRGTPSRMDKRVASDKGAADKQCLRRRKTLIPNRGRWSSLSLFRQIHLGEGKL